MSGNSHVCYLCKQELPISDFTQRIDDRYYKMCKSCVSEILSKRKSGERLNHTETHRTCALCRRFLANNQFTRRSKGSYYSACKECNKNVYAQRRRARKMGAEGSFTTKEWEEKKAQYDSCPGCGKFWEDIECPPHLNSVIARDHIIPLSKGGTNFIDNIQPMCYSCNSQKGDRIE
jgi:RNA polymerase-binding transcription factor DksA